MKKDHLHKYAPPNEFHLLFQIKGEKIVCGELVFTAEPGTVFNKVGGKWRRKAIYPVHFLQRYTQRPTEQAWEDFKRLESV